MNLNLNEYFKKHEKITTLLGGTGFRRATPRLRCRDGFSISAQVGPMNYCEPRELQGPYSRCELGYPSDSVPDFILEYAEHREEPTHCVYPYVPVELVEKLIDMHGGLEEL
jgi:hypothetical protein